MAIILFNGQPSPIRGWFADGHGHRILIRRGDMAPICPRLGPGVIQWRLMQEIPEIR